MSDWKARRILKEICDADRRRAVLATFGEEAEPQMRARRGDDRRSGAEPRTEVGALTR